ncbi:DUF445 domain-containing protein [Evansella sp. AB-rgal1]|uniref:DUF445 domain-containing protein n=1 Tax=Evansella sp. AB-rgal1 TaxID=3242696 RepID=UPI00359CEDDD
MEFYLLWFIGLIVIGALIGGGTNILAIRMLFRPHKPVYVRSWKVPFTPGLIPKRRKEIASQLGKMVEEHLVTPEGIAKKILDESFLNQLDVRFQEFLHSFLQQDKSLHEILEKNVGSRWSLQKVNESYESLLKERIYSFVNEQKQKPIEEILTEEWRDKLEGYIPAVSHKILTKVENYLQSPAGNDQIESMVARFFETKGNVGGLLGRMVQRVSLSTIVSKEFTKLLQEDRVKVMLNTMLQNELEQLLKKTPEELMYRIPLDEKVDSIVAGLIAETPIIGEWNKPMSEWAVRYEPVIVQSFFPKAMEMIVFILESNLKSMMKHLGIREIVEDQINNFPLEKLETMLISVTNRELKMIAVLGAAIGGIIGLVQGLLLLVLI